MWALLRRRDFALLWLGGLVSIVGDWMLLMVLPFYVYERTGSALASGATWIAFTLPAIFLGSVAGVFVDRWDRKRVLVVVSLGQVAVLLGLLAAPDAALVPAIYLVTFAQRALALFSGPAEGALLPRLVGAEDLTAANALNALNDNLGRVSGPVIGGALLATAGLASVVIVDLATFLVAAGLIALVHVPPATGVARPALAPQESGPADGGVWREWLAGLRLVRRERMLGGLFVVTATGVLGDSIATALVVPFFTDILRGDAGQYGWLQAARGVGGIAGGIVIGLAARRVTPGRMLACSMVAVGLVGVVRYNVPILWLYLACNVLAGVLVMGWLIPQNTIIQRHAADRYRGRVFAAYGTTAALLMLAGVTIGGALAGRVGIVPLLNLSSGLYALAGLFALALPRGTEQPATPDPVTESRPR